MNETSRVELDGGGAVVVRVARHEQPWFVDEAALMERARAAGLPTAQVLALEHLDDEDGVLSVSVQTLLPGRPLEDVGAGLDREHRERLVVEAGEVLARIHALDPDRGEVHRLRAPAEEDLERARRTVATALGPEAAEVVDRAAAFVAAARTRRPEPDLRLAQGDFMPKNLLVHEGRISGVVDWEFAGPAPPAFDLARWEVSAGPPWHDETAPLHRGYARVSDPEAAAAGLVPAYALDWALEKLAWREPATPAQVRRCVEVVVRHAGP
ncbi:phosphotransferase [Phycicoccus sp. CMS6Z-2]|nr:phosphotransferase [Phycicoccus flavus]